MSKLIFLCRFPPGWADVTLNVSAPFSVLCLFSWLTSHVKLATVALLPQVRILQWTEVMPKKQAKKSRRQRNGSPVLGKHSPGQMPRHILAKAWQFLGKDENTDLSKWPELRQDCVRHYAMLLNDSRPSPLVGRLWTWFGYCIAKDLADEKEIAFLYISLIHRCTFDEFCAAYESFSLFYLMDKYNLAPASGGRLRHLPDVLSLPLIMTLSVWYLKACILTPDSPLVVSPMPQARLPAGSTVYAIDTPRTLSAIFDYGFINCASQAEREALLDVYKVAFHHAEFDEVELHRACIQGKTFSYVKRFVLLTASDERETSRLMKSFYPQHLSSKVPVLRYVTIFVMFVLVCLGLYLFKAS
ncbi:hypothetical protein BDZ89DRAFT_1240585 [Hymenopellis radicata]|nr:hypothetical protein BDZ89DRAFT_1240585 [Hymenopellis radicata]